MSDIIKPCPFCGAEGEPQSINGRWIGCVNVQCRALGPTRDQWSDAIAAWNAAPRATAPASNTVRVRIAVGVAADGAWNCCGWSGATDDELTENLALDGDRLTWITANVPLPEPAAEIEAEIEP